MHPNSASGMELCLAQPTEQHGSSRADEAEEPAEVAALSPCSAPARTGGEGSSRARDFINRDLLDELSHEPSGWHEPGRAAPTPPLAGFETPSDSGSPHAKYFGRGHHSNHQHNRQAGLSSIDHWDWKLDAAEFVPGSMRGVMSSHDTQAGGFAAGWAPVAQNGTGDGPGDGAVSSGTDMARVSQLRAQYEWQLRTKGDELRDMQNRLSQMELETAQVRASWEMERRNLMRQIGTYRSVLERYCIPVEEAGSTNLAVDEEEGPSGLCPSFEPSASSQWLSGGAPGPGGSGSQSQAGGGFSGPGSAERSPFLGPSSAPLFGGGGAPGASSSLDSKMRQLNHLLQEGQAARRRPLPDADSSGCTGGREGAEGEALGGGSTYTSGAIASTLRAMFPHATIRTGRDGSGEEGDAAPDVPSEAANGRHPEPQPSLLSLGAMLSNGDPEAQAVDRLLRRLEQSTGNVVDERAMRSLQGLLVRDAKEAVGKVDELVQSQGGQCRNLSSILQSVCRKIEKRSKAPKAEEDPSERPADTGRRPRTDSNSGTQAGTAGAGASSSGPNSRARRTRRQDEDGDAFDSAGSDRDCDRDRGFKESRPVPKPLEPTLHRGPPAPLSRTNSLKSPTMAALDTPAGKRSWADMGSDHEEEDREGPA